GIPQPVAVWSKVRVVQRGRARLGPEANHAGAEMRELNTGPCGVHERDRLYVNAVNAEVEQPRKMTLQSFQLHVERSLARLIKRLQEIRKCAGEGQHVANV